MADNIAKDQERIPSLPASQAAIAEIIKAPELDAKHKLKDTLPIIPYKMPMIQLWIERH